MIKSIQTILLVTVCFLLCSPTGFGQKPLEADGLPSLKGKKVLMVYGGWKGHKPKEFTYLVAPWLKEQGAIVTISDSLGVYTDEKIMSETDLIIQAWTMDKMTKEQANGLLKAVKNGVGLAGCHGGLGDSFRNNTNYQYMVGGQWVAHPGGGILYSVNITDKEDPITKGLNDFPIKSEQYYMHVDPNVDVLATTTFSAENDSWIGGAIVPVVWKKHFGKGRVFYISLGHDPAEFETIPEARAMLMRGFRWAGGSKYQAVEHLIRPVYPNR